MALLIPTTLGPVAGNMTHGRPPATYASITREEASVSVCTLLAGFDGEDSQVMAKAPDLVLSP